MSTTLYRGTGISVAGVGADPGPNQLVACFTGLGTDPNGPADGQRAQATYFQSLYPGGDWLIWGWSQVGWHLTDATLECENLWKIMQSGNARGPYTHFLFDGHSFGGSFLHFFIWWLSLNHPEATIDLVRFLDPVPNPYDSRPWLLPMRSVRRAMQWTQHNGMALDPLLFWERFGPNGTPLIPDDNSRSIETVDFPGQLIATIDHIRIVTDPRVWGPSLQAMIQAVTPAAPSANP